MQPRHPETSTVPAGAGSQGAEHATNSGGKTDHRETSR